MAGRGRSRPRRGRRRGAADDRAPTAQLRRDVGEIGIGGEMVERRVEPIGGRGRSAPGPAGGGATGRDASPRTARPAARAGSSRRRPGNAPAGPAQLRRRVRRDLHRDRRNTLSTAAPGSDRGIMRGSMDFARSHVSSPQATAASHMRDWLRSPAARLERCVITRLERSPAGAPEASAKALALTRKRGGSSGGSGRRRAAWRRGGWRPHPRGGRV